MLLTKGARRPRLIRDIPFIKKSKPLDRIAFGRESSLKILRNLLQRISADRGCNLQVTCNNMFLNRIPTFQMNGRLAMEALKQWQTPINGGKKLVG